MLFGGAFVEIEHAVSALDDVRHLVAGLVGLPADGEPNGQFPAVDLDAEVFEALENVGELSGFAIHQQHHEFVAAPTSGKVGAASGAVEELGEFLEDGVAGLVAVGVVDLLVVVDVDRKSVV